MWKQIANYFGRYPSQAKVAKLLLENGMRVSGGRIYSGDVEVADVALGRAAGVDRRIVRSAIETIESSPELAKVFAALRPTLLLRDVAPVMGWSAIEIIPSNANATGIVADVTTVISNAGISIRQVLVGDPDLSVEPKLYVITQSPVPAELIPSLKACRGVRSIVIY
ncbi:MAG TPA: regulator of amino acid metabolism, contains ACT domain protein [Methanomassiliicoccales archaeon]|jgi:hypothetical protein